MHSSDSDEESKMMSPSQEEVDMSKMQSPGLEVAKNNDEELMKMDVGQQMRLGEGGGRPGILRRTSDTATTPNADDEAFLENSHTDSGPTNTPEPRSGERPILDLSRPSIDRYMAMKSVSDEKAESNDQPGDQQTKPTLVENAKTTMQNGGAAVTNALQNGGAAVTNALTSVWKGVAGLMPGKGKDEGNDKVEETMTPTTNQGPNGNQASPTTTSQASDPAVDQAIELEDEKNAWWKPNKWNPFGTSDPAQPADSVKPAPAAGVTGVSESQAEPAEEPKLPEAQPAAAAAPTKTKGGWFSPFSNALGGMKEKLQNLTGQTKQSDADEKATNPEAEEPKQESKQTAKRRRLCVGYTNDGVCPLGNEASSTNMCTPCYNRRPL